MKSKILLIMSFLLVCSVSFAEDWKEYKKQHFVIYYKSAPQDIVKNVEESAEHYYDEITKSLGFTRYKGWTWEDRAKIYIYDDVDDYVKSGGQAAWSHGSASVMDRTIRTFPSAHGFFDSTLPHELGHIIFREFVGFNARIPLWFEEGVAMYQEKAKRWGANKVVLDSIKNKTFIELSAMTPYRLATLNSSPDMVDLFYAESASVVYYLIEEFGEYRFESLCRKIRDGITFETALAAVYIRFKSIDDLNKKWVEYLKR